MEIKFMLMSHALAVQQQEQNDKETRKEGETTYCHLRRQTDIPAEYDRDRYPHASSQGIVVGRPSSWYARYTGVKVFIKVYYRVHLPPRRSSPAARH